jgi:alpha-L-rhamnosidase
MTSFNHYALGAVADWMHRSVAGLGPAAPGYREITVRPILPAQLNHASARHVTPYGEAAVSSVRRQGAVDVKVTVPVGCSAIVELPDSSPAIRIGHGEHEWSVPVGTVAGAVADHV